MLKFNYGEDIVQTTNNYLVGSESYSGKKIPWLISRASSSLASGINFNIYQKVKEYFKWNFLPQTHTLGMLT